MSKETREYLSCLMDGEIDQESSRFLMRRLISDGEMSATWSRYHLVRDCMRHQEGQMAAVDLRSRVSLALEREDTVRRTGWHPSRWIKPVGGAAVAASVALMAIVAVGPARQAGPAAVDSPSATVETQPFSSPQGLITGPATQQVNYQGKMNSYLLRHYQATGSTGTRGFVRYVPIVVTPASEAAQAENEADNAADNAVDKPAEDDQLK